MVKSLLNPKVSAVLVVDISTNLTLLNVDLAAESEKAPHRAEIKVTALKIRALPAEKTDEFIVDSLAAFIKENQITHKNAILVLPINIFLAKRFTLPVMPKDELTQTLKWQIKGDIAYEVSGAILDYQILSKEVKSDGAQMLDIFSVAAEETALTKQVLLLKQVGLSCLALGYPLSGYAQLLKKYYPSAPDELIAVLYVGQQDCQCAIYKGNQLEFNRELPVSINKLKDSLRGTLVSDRGQTELSEEEIDDVLFNIGVPNEDAVYKDKMTSHQILSMLRLTLERFAGELRRSLAYYGMHYGDAKLKEILITGPGARVPNLEKFLAAELDLGVAKMDLADKIKIAGCVDPRLLPQAHRGLGFALGYKELINLLPRAFRTERVEKIQAAVLSWGGYILCLLFITSFIFLKVRTEAYAKSLKTASATLSTLAEIKNARSRIDEFNNFITGIKKSELPLALVFKKISNIVGGELFFNNFSMNLETKSGGIGGYVEDTGKDPAFILSKFIRELEGTGYFSNVNISSMDRGSPERTNFEINFTIKN